MIEGSGFIIFIRKADSPQTPYFTVEIENNVVRQCRGENNCDMSDDVKNFVDQWQWQLKSKAA